MRTELKSRIGPLRASSYRDAIFGVPTTPETRRASARPPVHRPSSLRHPSSPSSSSWSFRTLLLFLLFLLLLPITPGSPHLPSAISFNSFVSLSSWPLLLPNLDAVCRVQLFYDTPVCSFSPRLLFSLFLILELPRSSPSFCELLRASVSCSLLVVFLVVRFSSPDLLVASRSSRRFPLLVLHRLPFTSISGGSCRALRFMWEERNRSTPEYTADSDFAECPGFFDRRGKAGGKVRRTLR